MLMINQTNNLMKKEWENTETTKERNELFEYVKNQEEMEKLASAMVELIKTMTNVDKNKLENLEKIKEGLNIENQKEEIPTGYAVDYNDKLAFEDVYVPFEKEKTDILEGYIEKTNDAIKEINYEIEQKNNQKMVTEEELEEIIEKEDKVIKTLCKNCENMEKINGSNQTKFKRKVRKDLEDVIDVNNKIEKVAIKNEDTITDKIKKKIRNVSVQLYNVYISFINEQKGKMMKEIYKLKVALEKTDNANVKFEGKDNYNQKMIMPVNGKVSSVYGKRIHPIKKHIVLHDGIDIAVPLNTKVISAADGKVVKAKWNGGYGNYIEIDHGNGIHSFYGHLNSYNVKAGDDVLQGQEIGKSGNTGGSTGPHLHFGVHKNGNTVNPYDYINKN